MCITGASGTDVVEQYITNAGAPVNCTGANATGSDPYQVMIIANPANASGNTAEETLNIVVGLADGTTAPGRIKVVVEDDGAGSTINAFPGNSVNATLQGHPGAAGAAAVGAAFYLNTPACGTTPAGLEYFSSEGGTPILFDTAGNRLATPVVRQKPDFVGPNGGNDTFLGFTLTASQSATSIAGCKNNANYPNFFGTSAATPHVAGIAALMLQANPAVTPAQIYQALRASALPMDTVSPNFDSGYGFVQADAAFALTPQVAPASPTVTLDKSSIVIGDSVTLTWSSVDATSCTASGSWTGTDGGSGSVTVTPTAVGTQTYSLACANSAGTSTATSVTLDVTAMPAKSGGGGGGMDVLALLGLAAAGMARVLRFRRRVLI